MPKFKPLAITFVFGAAVGIGCGFLMDHKKSQHVSTPVEEETPIASDARKLEQLEYQLAQLERENAELKQLQEVPLPRSGSNIARAVPMVFFSSRPGERPDPEEMIKQTRPHFASMAERMVAQISKRLGLNNEQENAMQEILAAQQEQTHRFMTNQFDGSDNRVESNVERITSDDIMDLAREIMTPAQFEDYSETKVQERQSRNEMIATAQLSRLAPALGLSDEQKDAAYSIYYSEADENSDAFDPLGMEESRKKSGEVIYEMLTPEQKELYDDMKSREGQGGQLMLIR